MGKGPFGPVCVSLSKDGTIDGCMDICLPKYRLRCQLLISMSPFCITPVELCCMSFSIPLLPHFLSSFYSLYQIKKKCLACYSLMKPNHGHGFYAVQYFSLYMISKHRRFKYRTVLTCIVICPQQNVIFFTAILWYVICCPHGTSRRLWWIHLQIN